MSRRRENTAFTLVELPAVSRCKCAAFTLVELLVVVGIIAVLIGILLPTIARARESANTISCASNLRELGQGIATYVREYKGYIPPSEPPLGPPWEFTRWPCILVGTKCISMGTADTWGVQPPVDLFRCPSDTTVDPEQGVDVNFKGSSYITNGRVMPRATFYPAPFRQPQKANRFKQHSQRLVLTEKDASNATYFYGGPVGLSPSGTWCYQATIDRVTPRHGSRKKPTGLANVLFLDGHVTAMQYADIVKPAQQALAGNPDPDPDWLWGTEGEFDASH